MKDALIVSLLSLAPRKRSARTMGWLARSRLSRLVVRLFVRAYKVDLSEARGTLADYPTLEDLFTRELEEGARPIDTAPQHMVSPVDGQVAYVGRTVDGQVQVAPGRHLHIGSLLGGSASLTEERDAVVLYLSPRDYHRVHVPREGHAVSWRYLPGTLWPVFPAAVRRVNGLFQRNERMAVRLETTQGPLDVVMVGAFGVGRITVSFCDLVTNTGRKACEALLDPAVPVTRGDLLGIFHLGSTVVLVAPPGKWRWTVQQGQDVRLGVPLAEATHKLIPERGHARAER